MKVAIPKEVSLTEIKEKLEADLPGIIVKWQGPKVLLIYREGQKVAAAVQRMGGNVFIQPNFPTMGRMMAYMLIMILFGIVIPMLIYITAIKPKQDIIRREVEENLKKHWGKAAF